MGAVYLAHELALDRDVAIKVLPPEHASTPQMRERFRREARTAARLNHPHIVPLYTFGEVSGIVYFVMGFVAGESLAMRLQRAGPYEPEEARTFLVALCDALDYAHRQGVVHRDIKPDNILIDAGSDSPLLTDFGIAKPAFAERELTLTGQLIGTPHYMSPEQARGHPGVDARSDLYSLGVVAYEMVSGRPPFDSDTVLETLAERLTQDARPVSAAVVDLPSDIALAIDRCLQRDADKRWPDARSLRETLQPTDEQSEDSFPARALRIGVTIETLSVVLFAYLSLYAAVSADFILPLRGIGMLIGTSVPAAFLAIIGILGLRSEGLSPRVILKKPFEQPRWWRSWYPQSLRRRGDIWHRLPAEVRRFRTCRGILQIYGLGILLPLQVILRRSTLDLLVLWSIMVAALVWVFAERQKATRFVLEKTNATREEASALLTTPTWGVSVWRRAPASRLFGGRTPRPQAAKPSTPSETELPASERPTRL